SNPDDFALRFSGISATSDARWDDFDGGANDGNSAPGSVAFAQRGAPSAPPAPAASAAPAPRAPSAPAGPGTPLGRINPTTPRPAGAPPRGRPPRPAGAAAAPGRRPTTPSPSSGSERSPPGGTAFQISAGRARGSRTRRRGPMSRISER